MNYGFPAKLAQRAAYFSPYYTRDIDMMPMIVALVFTPLWLLAMTRKNIRGRQAVTNWAAGTTVVWALLMTLFLPWIDAAKSYRPLVQQIEKSLLPETKAVLKTGAECVYINPKNQDARRAWQFYADYAYSIRDTNCRYELAQYVSEPKLPERTKIVWQGRRPRNKTEWFVLIEK